MADKLIGGMFRRAKNTQGSRYAASSRDVARLMRLFRTTIDALSEADKQGADSIQALEDAVGWHVLFKARTTVAVIADTVRGIFANIERVQAPVNLIPLPSPTCPLLSAFSSPVAPGSSARRWSAT